MATFNELKAAYTAKVGEVSSFFDTMSRTVQLGGGWSLSIKILTENNTVSVLQIIKDPAGQRVESVHEIPVAVLVQYVQFRSKFEQWVAGTLTDLPLF